MFDAWAYNRSHYPQINLEPLFITIKVKDGFPKQQVDLISIDLKEKSQYSHVHPNGFNQFYSLIVSKVSMPVSVLRANNTVYLVLADNKAGNVTDPNATSKFHGLVCINILISQIPINSLTAILLLGSNVVTKTSFNAMHPRSLRDTVEQRAHSFS